MASVSFADELHELRERNDLLLDRVHRLRLIDENEEMRGRRLIESGETRRRAVPLENISELEARQRRLQRLVARLCVDRYDLRRKARETRAAVGQAARAVALERALSAWKGATSEARRTLVESAGLRQKLHHMSAEVAAFRTQTTAANERAARAECEAQLQFEAATQARLAKEHAERAASQREADAAATQAASADAVAATASASARTIAALKAEVSSLVAERDTYVARLGSCEAYLRDANAAIRRLPALVQDDDDRDSPEDTVEREAARLRRRLEALLCAITTTHRADDRISAGERAGYEDAIAKAAVDTRDLERERDDLRIAQARDRQDLEAALADYKDLDDTYRRETATQAQKVLDLQASLDDARHQLKPRCLRRALLRPGLALLRRAFGRWRVTHAVLADRSRQLNHLLRSLQARVSSVSGKQDPDAALAELHTATNVLAILLQHGTNPPEVAAKL